MHTYNNYYDDGVEYALENMDNWDTLWYSTGSN